MSERAISRLTGISRGTLYGYKKGLYKPGSLRQTILKKGYGKAVYQVLRSSGASITTAQKYRFTTPENVDDIQIRILKIAQEVADREGISLEDALLGMGHSADDIDAIEDRY